MSSVAEQQREARAMRAERQAPQIVSMGCRLNIAEGEVMSRLAAAQKLGDVVIINSCAVTNEAVRQTRQAIRRSRRKNPAARIVVTGCAAQIDPAMFAQMPEVDAVFGNAEKLGEEAWRMLAAQSDSPLFAVNDIMTVRENAPQLIEGYGDRARAFLQIQNGCDHRCTFCIIPYGRGDSRSTPADLVVESARRLVGAGHPEIVLTGVDITSWGNDLEGAPRLGRLVGEILDSVPELVRLRLSSLDCAEIDPELFDRLTGDQRVAPHLHLSVQAGDNLILKRMKRRHSREDAINLCRRIRAIRPETAFGADMIAGFPTETEAMFANSLALIDDAGLNYVHVFPYSARAGTPAARMPQLARSVVADRARRLRASASRATAIFLETQIGRESVAVVESGGRARLGNFAAVQLSPDQSGAIPGEVRRVKITGCNGELLDGVFID